MALGVVLEDFSWPLLLESLEVRGVLATRVPRLTALVGLVRLLGLAGILRFVLLILILILLKISSLLILSLRNCLDIILY